MEGRGTTPNTQPLSGHLKSRQGGIQRTAIEAIETLEETSRQDKKGWEVGTSPAPVTPQVKEHGKVAEEGNGRAVARRLGELV